jgi:hypothetical protein
MCVALIPFFAFKELRRVYGGAAFDSLVFKGEMRRARRS